MGSEHRFGRAAASLSLMGVGFRCLSGCGGAEGAYVEGDGEGVGVAEQCHSSPVLDAEHAAMLALVPDAQATHRIVASGDWDDAAIWANQSRPTAPWANVVIEEAADVRLDSIEPVPLRTLRIDGRLHFEPTVDTALLVDTIVVTEEGELEVGSEATPIDAAKTATITFADTGPIDRVWDPYGFSRGLLSHGAVSIHGQEKTAFVAVTSVVAKSATTLKLASAPVGWAPGDRLVLTGTQPLNPSDTEERTITAASGATITLSPPLAYDHLTPAPGLYPYLANLTRNVRFKSQNAADGRRGHVMFMHSDDVDVAGAGFYQLGRTNKAVPIVDAVVVNGQLQAGSGTNVRGRYAVHVHRSGLSNPADPVVIRASVVDDSSGWGFTNHSSNVLFSDNVAYRVFGAGFVTEAGDELGTFLHNLAVKSTGKAGLLEARTAVQDFGYEGWGFWFQGAGGLHIVDNVASNNPMAGFMVYAGGLTQAGLGLTGFPTQFLADASWANGAATVKVGWAPIPEFAGNEVFCSGQGVHMIYELLLAPHNQRFVVEGLRTWNLANYATALYLPYTNQATVKNSVLLGTPAKPSGAGVGGTNATNSIIFDNVRMDGFLLGAWLPMTGDNKVIGGQYHNAVNFSIPTGAVGGRQIEFSGAVQLGPLSSGFDVSLDGTMATSPFGFPALFEQDRVLMNTGPNAGKQLYFAEQAPTFVPFPAGQAQSHVPSELLGKTNQAIWTQYGMAIYGALAPAGATTTPTIKGLLGTPATYPPKLSLVSPQQVGSASYQLSYRDAAGVTVKDPVLFTLKPGWNVLTRVIGGTNRSFLVYGTAPAVAPPPPPPPAGAAGTFELSLSDLPVWETSGTMALKVKRVGGSSGTVGITWGTQAETALSGSDFQAQPAVLAFGAGEVEKTIMFAIVNDKVHEELETFRVVLSSPTGGATMTEAKRRCQVRIHDEDP